MKIEIPKNIIEIVQRRTGSQYEESEMISVVKEYIRLRKGVNVDINIYKGLDMQYFNHPIMKIQIMKRIQNLHNAFERACWSINNIVYGRDWDEGIIK